VSRLSFGLLGSGEFEPWNDEVDRWLLDRATGDGSVLILPTASAAEGDEVFDRWADMGLEHYRRTGIPARVLPLKTREDAGRPELAAKLERASMAFFSGGNPAYLAGVLSGTPFWAALVAAMGRGLAYAGCSAGVACLGEVAPDSSVGNPSSRDVWRPGLRLFPEVYFGPHWDALDRFFPGLQGLFLAAVPPGCRLLAIDERTAVVGDGTRWSVVGSGLAQLLEDGTLQEFASGASFDASLTSAQALAAAASRD
jgi:cyanophycinase-like exopeptidase